VGKTFASISSSLLAFILCITFGSGVEARPLFGQPQPVCGINSPNLDAGSWLSPDGLTIYFGTNRAADGDIFVATRPDPAACFGTPAVVAELSPRSGGPTLSPDQLTIFFDSTRSNPAIQELYEASRPDTASTFGPVRYLDELNFPPYQTSHPSLTADGLELFFFSDRPGGNGSQDIWVATRPNTSVPFGNPVPVSQVNSPYDDRTPQITADGLRLYFASDRPDGNLGGQDVRTSGRPAGQIATPRLGHPSPSLKSIQRPRMRHPTCPSMARNCTFRQLALGAQAESISG
jgi:Tol biopolymer transport system component